MNREDNTRFVQGRFIFCFKKWDCVASCSFLWQYTLSLDHLSLFLTLSLFLSYSPSVSLILSPPSLYIVISVVWHTRIPLLGSKPVVSNTNPRLYTSVTRKPAAAKQILNGYESLLLLFTYIRLTATESSFHLYEEPRIYANGNAITSFARRAYIYIYIYIYI